MYRLFCVFFALSAVSAKHVDVRRLKRSVGNPVFTDCGNANRIIEFKELHFSPNPITIPGKLTVTFHAVNTRALPNMDIDVKMVRKMSIGGLKWDMNIMCIAEVGSCKYEDICQRMVEQSDDDLPVLKKLRQSLQEAGAPSRCPIAANSPLNIRNMELELPEMPASLQPISGLADGTYGVTYRILRHRTNVELGCLSVEATITTQQEEDDDCWWWC